MTAVLTLALGIAANATIFAMMTGFLMPKLPGRDADKVVVVSSVNPDDSFLPDTYRVSAPNFQTIRADTRAFAQTAALIDGNSGSLGGEHEQPEAIQYETVTPNFFSILGAAPELGRGFLAGEDQPGRDRVVILSHALWARRYGSDPASWEKPSASIARTTPSLASWAPTSGSWVSRRNYGRRSRSPLPTPRPQRAEPAGWWSLRGSRPE